MTVSRRLVLMCHPSASDEVTPPLHRVPPGQQAGARSLAKGASHGRAFVPELWAFPVLVPSFRLSVRQQWFTHVRLRVAHLTGCRRAFFATPTPPRLLTDAACGALGSAPAQRARRANLHHWSSTVNAGDLLRRNSPFRTHPIATDISAANPTGNRWRLMQTSADQRHIIFADLGRPRCAHNGALNDSPTEKVPRQITVDMSRQVVVATEAPPAPPLSLCDGERSVDLFRVVTTAWPIPRPSTSEHHRCPACHKRATPGGGRGRPRLSKVTVS